MRDIVHACMVQPSLSQTPFPLIPPPGRGRLSASQGANNTFNRGIYTYIGKGCRKSGVKADRHGVVYAEHSKPWVHRDEPKLGFAPIRMQIEVSGETLAKESRVNYSKLVSLEHNVRVFIIGRISPDDFPVVADAVNECWSRKTHTRGNGRRAKGE